MDAALASEAGAGNRELVLDQLVDEHGDRVLQLAYFYVKDRELAEDIFQDVFTRVYLHLDRFRGDSSVKTWIYRITVNLCRDRLRSWSVRNVLLLGEEWLGRHEAGIGDISDTVLEQADRQALLEVVMQLPVEYREVVLLYYYEEMDSVEVARALSLSEGTVRSRLHLARARMKKMLTEGGFVRG